MKAPYHYNSFISCDIETSGLKTDRAELFSVAMISDNDTAFRNAVKVENLPYIDIVIIKPEGGFFQHKGMQMNAALLGEIADVNFRLEKGETIENYYHQDRIEALLVDHAKGEKYLTYREQLERLNVLNRKVYADPLAALYIISTFVRYVKMERLDGSEELEIGGKNFGKFDFQILCNFFERELESDEIFQRQVLAHASYRFLEVGSMFRPIFGKLVSLGKIIKLFGQKEDVDHTAYADGVDTVKAARLATLKIQNPEVSLEELAKGVG